MEQKSAILYSANGQFWV